MTAVTTHLVIARETDPFRTLLTPSRDAWEAVLLGEIEEILKQTRRTDRDKAIELLALVNRERDRNVAEER